MQRKGAFDYILLETTGLADPGTLSMMVTKLALNAALNCTPRPNCIDILAQ
jgi:G3E family GTPase